tara:strand:- start:908 stop:1966 length:1059 start_codon:yes stop_codon:yes gene_type:complete
MGLLYNTASIFRGISGFVSGILSDKSNFLYWIILFAALSSLGSWIISYSSDLNMFSFGVIVLGIGSGIYHPVGTSAITKYTVNTAKSLGYHSLGGAIGIALAPWFFINISSNYSWELSYFIFGIFTLPIILIYIDKEIRNLKSDLKPPTEKSIKELNYKKVTPIFIYASLKDFSISGLFLMLAVFVNELTKESISDISDVDFYTSLISSVIILFGGIGAFTGGYLDNLKSRKNILLYSCLIAGIFFLATTNNLYFTIIVFTVISFLISSNDPSLGNWLGNTMPKNLHGTSFAFMYGLGQIIGSFSGSLAGVLLNYFSTTIYFRTLSLPLIVASIVVLYLYRNSQNKKNIASK